MEDKIKEPKETQFDTELDILKYLTQVQSGIKRDITSDFILAKLTEKKIRHINKGETKKVEETSIQIGEIKGHANMIFNAYMTKIIILVNLNRNVPENILLELLGGRNTENIKTTEENDAKSILEKIKLKVKRTEPKD